MDRKQVFCAGCDAKDLRIVALRAALREAVDALDGCLHEWDKFTRYGSPMAKAANERIAFARAARDKAKGLVDG